MPRFFFDIRVGDRLARDDDGIALESAEVARKEAEAVLPQIESDAPYADQPQPLVLTVRDEGGNSIFISETLTRPESTSNREE